MNSDMVNDFSIVNVFIIHVGLYWDGDAIIIKSYKYVHGKSLGPAQCQQRLSEEMASHTQTQLDTGGIWREKYYW